MGRRLVFSGNRSETEFIIYDADEGEASGWTTSGRRRMGQTEGGAEVDAGSANPRETEGPEWPFRLVRIKMAAPLYPYDHQSLGLPGDDRDLGLGSTLQGSLGVFVRVA